MAEFRITSGNLYLVVDQASNYNVDYVFYVNGEKRKSGKTSPGGPSTLMISGVSNQLSNGCYDLEADVGSGGTGPWHYRNGTIYGGSCPTSNEPLLVHVQEKTIDNYVPWGNSTVSLTIRITNPNPNGVYARARAKFTGNWLAGFPSSYLNGVTANVGSYIEAGDYKDIEMTTYSYNTSNPGKYLDVYFTVEGGVYETPESNSGPMLPIYDYDYDSPVRIEIAKPSKFYWGVAPQSQGAISKTLTKVKWDELTRTINMALAYKGLRGETFIPITAGQTKVSAAIFKEVTAAIRKAGGSCSDSGIEQGQPISAAIVKRLQDGINNAIDNM